MPSWRGQGKIRFYHVENRNVDGVPNNGLYFSYAFYGLLQTHFVTTAAYPCCLFR